MRISWQMMDRLRNYITMKGMPGPRGRVSLSKNHVVRPEEWTLVWFALSKDQVVKPEEWTLVWIALSKNQVARPEEWNIVWVSLSKNQVVRPEECTLVWVTLQQQGCFWLFYRQSSWQWVPWVPNSEIPSYISHRDLDKWMVQLERMRTMKGTHSLGQPW